MSEGKGWLIESYASKNSTETEIKLMGVMGKYLKIDQSLIVTSRRGW